MLLLVVVSITVVALDESVVLSNELEMREEWPLLLSTDTSLEKKTLFSSVRGDCDSTISKTRYCSPVEVTKKPKLLSN